jgi:hypothetical protein
MVVIQLLLPTNASVGAGGLPPLAWTRSELGSTCLRSASRRSWQGQ